jgi:ribosomal protein S1
LVICETFAQPMPSRHWLPIKQPEKKPNKQTMKIQIALFALVAAALVAVPATSFAQDLTTNTPATNTPAVKKQGQRFHGKVAAVDATAGTITVGKTTYSVTADTKITKDSKTATLADFAVGDNVGGFAKKDGDKLTATVLHNAKKKKAE